MFCSGARQVRARGRRGDDCEAEGRDAGAGAAGGSRARPVQTPSTTARERPLLEYTFCSNKQFSC